MNAKKIAMIAAAVLGITGFLIGGSGKITTNPEFNDHVAVATFAGGCFWCMVPPFEKLDGVTKVLSGYTGGTTKNPTYEEVGSGKTGHVESIQVTYDPGRIGYLK